MIVVTAREGLKTPGHERFVAELAAAAAAAVKS
jgi:hypothetical protein